VAASTVNRRTAFLHAFSQHRQNSTEADESLRMNWLDEAGEERSEEGAFVPTEMPFFCAHFCADARAVHEWIFFSGCQPNSQTNFLIAIPLRQPHHCPHNSSHKYNICLVRQSQKAFGETIGGINPSSHQKTCHKQKQRSIIWKFIISHLRVNPK